MRKNWWYINLLLLLSSTHGWSQQPWVSAVEGINQEVKPPRFVTKFKSDVGGKDWMYGSFYDEDSVLRIAATREGGRWKPLPISALGASITRDIVMYGDTIYFGGDFNGLALDQDSTRTFPTTSIIKCYNDSIWVETDPIFGVYSMSTLGDSLIIWGDLYHNPPDPVIYHLFMTPDGGSNWMYPFSIVHPTDTTGSFGARPGVMFVDGDVYILNNASPIGSPYNGVCRWDGTQWHSYGPGPHWTQSYCMEMFNNKLIMGGGFYKDIDPDDPGNCVVQWEGTHWNQMAGGTNQVVLEMFVHDSLLYCVTLGATQFGDAQIFNVAAWDGLQWCGTPVADFSRPPVSAGFVNDTLFFSFDFRPIYQGDTLPLIVYFDGDYANGPDAVCSSPDIGLQENSFETLNVYPNPTKGVFHFDLPEFKVEHVEVTDMFGRLVSPLAVTNEAIDLSNLPDGVYFVKLSAEKKVFTAKCIKASEN